MLSVPQLRARVNLPSSSDPALVALRDAVVALWERESGRIWSEVVNRVEVVRAETDRQRLLFLRAYPVVSIGKVEERQDLSGATYSELAADGYDVYEDRGLLKLCGWWSPTVRVTYSGGYNADTCPADVREALLTQAAFWVARTSGDKIAVKGEAFEKGTVSFEDADMHPSFKTAAQSWRRRST